jgi:ubiquinone/menaquinone biosynthesis C-methylase UbiE
MEPLVALDDDVLPPMFGDVADKRVLDLACGAGRHTLRLVRAGARVTAVDFSMGLLTEAQKRVGEGVTFIEADITRSLPIFVEHDLVVCALALQQVRELKPVFGEIARVLKPEGVLVVSAIHPAMRLRNGPIRVSGFDHAISEYVMAALGAGFRIERAEEYKGTSGFGARFAVAATYVGWPMLFVLRATRASA